MIRISDWVFTGFLFILCSSGVGLLFYDIATLHEENVEQQRQEDCDEANLIVAGNILCLSDKEFKCFVTPENYKEFSRAMQTKKALSCKDE